ncbi:FAD-dependent monooxygenase [Peribacillus frigoritolerans]|nr:FAD-dependent monooxygenase [Peribacillus frigoritolerans]
MLVKSDVCIVGSGPGGALLAYLLAKQDISVVLLERHSEVSREFRGEFLNDEGEGILKKHGLFESVERLGLLRMEQIEYWHDGRIFKSIFPEWPVDHVGIHVPQNHLLTAILNEAEKLDSFQLMMNTRVTGLMQNEMGRFTGVKARNGGNDLEVQSPLIIGADGRFSIVRKKREYQSLLRSMAMIYCGQKFLLHRGGSLRSRWHWSMAPRLPSSPRLEVSSKLAGI